jgi:hypothetical protein
VRPRGNVHAVAEGGLLAALSASLLLVGRVLPAGGLLFRVAGLVPVVRVTARHGRRAGAASAAVVGLLLAAVFGPLAGWGAFLSLAAFGVSLGWARRRRWDAAWAVAFTALAGAATVPLSLAETYLVTGIHPLAAAQAQLRVLLDAAVAELPRLDAALRVGAGLQARMAAWAAMARAWLAALTVLAVAALAAARALVLALLLYGADVALARRMGDPPPRLPRMAEAALALAGRLAARLRDRTGQR